MVSKQILFYNVVARLAPSCPPGADCGGNITDDFGRIDKDGYGMQTTTKLLLILPIKIKMDCFPTPVHLVQIVVGTSRMISVVLIEMAMVC